MALPALLVAAGLFIGWTLGANDGANAMGTAVGARVRTVREAVILIGLFGGLGAILYSAEVVHTIGNGVVPLSRIPAPLVYVIALTALSAAGLWLLAATYFGIPVSTTHAVVGAVAGAGLGAGDIEISWGEFGEIALAWAFTPVGAAIAGAVLVWLIGRASPGIRRLHPRAIPALLTLSGILAAFAWGANDAGNATGVIAGTGLMSPSQAAAVAGVALFVGVATWGYRVMRTVGEAIVPLDDVSALAAELGAALNVIVYTHFGFPVSTTHAIVGAVCGAGGLRSSSPVNGRTLRGILIAWTATPLVAGLVAFLLFHVMHWALV